MTTQQQSHPYRNIFFMSFENACKNIKFKETYEAQGKGRAFESTTMFLFILVVIYYENVNRSHCFIKIKT